MLFKKTFHAGIRDGSTTRTYRDWKAPRVTAGKRYRIAGVGLIEVEAVRPTTMASITDGDARRAGFADRAGLEAFLGRTAKGPRDGRSTLYRVDFHFLGEADEPLAERRADISEGAVEEALTRVARMDRLSRRGPWTGEVLGLIAERPRIAASRLAPRLGRETRAFKADVRKLKKLGLTISHRVGYELSPLGDAVLRALR